MGVQSYVRSEETEFTFGAVHFYTGSDQFADSLGLRFLLCQV